MRKILLAFALTLGTAGCGGGTTPPDSSPFLDGWKPTPAAAGYTRYVLPPVTDIQPGDNILKCQWIQEPLDHDTYVTFITGQQTAGGHHIVLYANKKSEPVGTTRDCTTDDMLNIGFVGAFGGEGNNTGEGQIPAGVGFVLPKGRALMSNTHYLNATTKAINGQGVVDVTFVDRASIKQVADLFANVNLSLQVPPGKTGEADTKCVFKQDVAFFRAANHMHEWGKSAVSTVTRLDGKVEEITRNDAWDREMTFNFPFVNWPVSQPFVIHAGDTLNTHCVWNNTTTRMIGFPDEMCVLFGFFVPGDGAQLTCQDGAWGG